MDDTFESCVIEKASKVSNCQAEKQECAKELACSGGPSVGSRASRRWSPSRAITQIKGPRTDHREQTTRDSSAGNQGKNNHPQDTASALPLPRIRERLKRIGRHRGPVLERFVVLALSRQVGC